MSQSLACKRPACQYFDHHLDYKSFFNQYKSFNTKRYKNQIPKTKKLHNIQT